MKVTYDLLVKAAYIDLLDGIQKGEACRQIRVNEDIILDFDQDGHLLGIELLSLRLLHPKLDPTAERL